MRLPFLNEKSGAIALVLPGLTAGWLSGRLVIRQAGYPTGRLAGQQTRNSVKFRNYILDEIFEFSLCLTKVWFYYSHTNAF